MGEEQFVDDSGITQDERRRATLLGWDVVLLVGVVLSPPVLLHQPHHPARKLLYDLKSTFEIYTYLAVYLYLES